MSQTVPQGTPDPVPYVPPQEEISQAESFVRAIDPNKTGFGAEKMRNLFPRYGWNKIFVVLDKLVQNGVLTKSSKRLPNAKVSVDWWTVV